MQSASASHATLLNEVEAAGLKRNLKVLPAEARTAQEIDQAFLAMAKDKTQAFIVAQHPVFNQHARRIAELATKHRLPSIAGPREYAEAGGLMSYGAPLYLRYSVTGSIIFRWFEPPRRLRR